jgi:hypothetical protein
VRAETPRGVVEVLLDRIRVDESYAGDLDAAPLEAPDWKDEAAAEQYEDPFARYELTR